MPHPSILMRALHWSGALRRKVDANPRFGLWLAEAATRPVTGTVIRRWLEELREGAAQEPSAPQAVRRQLRQARERVFFTLMVRDIEGAASLREVTAAMSLFADMAVAAAYRCVVTDLADVHGVPHDPLTGKPQELLVMGMGKLGGKELNVSSDIDLVMLYGEEGETTGRRKISHHEFYGRVTQRMMPVLAEPDACGRVFRTDLRLRPDGDSGPLAWSLDALENYLVSQGREWERYAWLKARALRCKAFAGSDPAAQVAELESLRTPFVYRKYFDFDSLSALRALRERIRQDWQRRALARNGVDAAHNIKLGDGGIREIEFVVQLNQLIRGGRMPSLQQRGLLRALRKQQAAGVLDDQTGHQLAAAYEFLRRIEHMLQYREDEQTHLLPNNQQLRHDLAATLGMQLPEFEARLARHREFVNQTFRNAFRLAGVGEESEDEARPAATLEPASGASLAEQIETQLGEESGLLARRIQAMLESHRIRSLPANSRKRLDALLPAVIRAAAKTGHAEQTAIRLLELIEQIAQRSAYLALLAEYPETLARVARIVGASPWAAQYLRQYPLLLDSLIEWNSLLEAPDFVQLAQQLREDMDACVFPDGQPDVEQQMNLMRDLQRQVSFQLLAQDLGGELSVERLADQLSALADMLLDETIRRAWPLVQPKGKSRDNLPAPRFAIIAYGKLGGKELGYASDLDLVFLYDDDRPDAPEIYARLGQRISSWLSTMTSSGRLYEIDLRLRPNGEAGMLAASLEAFEHYQASQAWAWEHQALTRARFVAGDRGIGERFEAIRRSILLMPRDPARLKEEVKSMRARISAGHPNRSGSFDIKHDRDGMVDLEFAIQYLVLSHAREHPPLLENLGNIALLRLAAQAGLIPMALADRCADAYRVYRRTQHALRLQGAEKARVPPDGLGAEREAVSQLWNRVIGA